MLFKLKQEKKLSPVRTLLEEVMLNENLDLLKFLREDLEGNLATVTSNDIDWTLAAIDKGIIKLENKQKNAFYTEPLFTGIVKALEGKYGMPIKAIHILSGMEDILEENSDEPLDFLSALEGYETGTKVTDLDDGRMVYAYSEDVKPISNEELARYLNDYKDLHRVYVYPGVGYNLQMMYLNMEEISPEDLVYACQKANKGYYIEDGTEEVEEDDRYMYVDMSSYNLPNVYFLIENILLGEGITLV